MSAVRPGPEGVTCWRWELARGDAGSTTANAPGMITHEKLSAYLETIPKGELLMRGDSVAFPPGGCAYLHRHQGPGIRCLIEGGIRIDTRVIRVSTGEIVKTAKVTGDEKKFFDLQQKLSKELLDGLRPGSRHSVLDLGPSVAANVRFLLGPAVEAWAQPAEVDRRRGVGPGSSRRQRPSACSLDQRSAMSIRSKSRNTPGTTSRTMCSWNFARTIAI